MGANPILTFEKQIVFFDSNCLLCSGFINILLKNDQGRFYYSGFESHVAKDVLAEALRSNPQTIIVLSGGELLFKSKAIFYIVKHLGFPWVLLRVFQLIPNFINNAIYDMVSRNRLAWFGRSNTCYLPTADQKDRFID
jgi:predicted DCC family thiol-disulfide oxidoreductase YuxK